MSERICSVDACDRAHYGRGWCQPHYRAWYSHGDPLWEPPPRTIPVCLIEDCHRLLVPPYGRGMCGLHYQRWRSHGDPHYTRPRNVGVAPCEVEGCDEVVIARGWCTKHYTRWERYGSPTARMPGEVMDGKRICPGCRADKPLSEYTPNSTGRCKRCEADRAIEWRQRNPGYPRTPYDPERGRAAAATWRLAHPDEVRAHAAKYRAAKMAATVENFQPVEIFERDGWTCGICGVAIDRSLRYPDVRSVSLDHVIPLSAGGAHSRANTQATHLICNLRKHARVPIP